VNTEYEVPDSDIQSLYMQNRVHYKVRERVIHHEMDGIIHKIISNGTKLEAGSLAVVKLHIINRMMFSGCLDLIS
jgi:hypothetical protein